MAQFGECLPTSVVAAPLRRGIGERRSPRARRPILFVFIFIFICPFPTEQDEDEETDEESLNWKRFAIVTRCTAEEPRGYTRARHARELQPRSVVPLISQPSLRPTRREVWDTDGACPSKGELRRALACAINRAE